MPITPEGYTRETDEEILAKIEADQLSEISPLWDVGAESPNGKNNRIMLRQLSQLHDVVGDIQASFNPTTATDDALENLSKISQTFRRGASFTEIDCAVEMDEGTTIVAGEFLAYPPSNPEAVFTPIADFTADADGFQAVTFICLTRGPIDVPIGQLVISTSTVGVLLVDSPGPARVGRPIDDDPTLRDRRDGKVATTGSGTVPALAADLLELDDVQATDVFENVTDTTDANGLPPHSFEALISDDGAADDDVVAQVIWDGKPAGIRPYGSESGTATDTVGNPHSVAFSRVTGRDIYLKYELVGTFDSDAVKTAVVDVARERFKTGKPVLRSLLFGAPMGIPFGGAVPGVENVLSLKLGFSASPTQSLDLSIGIREIARFDISRVEIV